MYSVLLDSGFFVNLLNGLLALAANALHIAYGLLPQSPLYIPTSVSTSLTPALGWVSWFLPLPLMLGTFTLWLVGVMALAFALLVKKGVEVIIDAF